MLVATGCTPRLMSLETMTAKPGAGGGSQNCATWKIEKAMHYFVHTSKANTDYSTDYGEKPQPLESWDVLLCKCRIDEPEE